MKHAKPYPANRSQPSQTKNQAEVYSYIVTNWGARYETSETKKRKSLSWVPVPNKHDGIGYRRMMQERDAAELFAAWVLILQVVSKNPRQERGMLRRDGVPLDAGDLALLTGLPARMFERAISFFSGPKIGWLTAPQGSVDAAADTANGAAAAAPAVVDAAADPEPHTQSASLPADDAAQPANDASEAVLNRREENGREDTPLSSPRGKSRRAKSTVERAPFPDALNTFEALPKLWEAYLAMCRKRKWAMLTANQEIVLEMLAGDPAPCQVLRDALGQNLQVAWILERRGRYQPSKSGIFRKDPNVQEVKYL